MFIHPVFIHHISASGKGRAGLERIIDKTKSLDLTSIQKSNAKKLIAKKIEEGGVFTEKDLAKNILPALQKKKIMSEEQANNFLTIAKGGKPKFEAVSKKTIEPVKAPKIFTPKVVLQKTQEIKKVEKNISGTSKSEVTKNSEVLNKKTPEINKNVKEEDKKDDKSLNSGGKPRKHAPISSLSYGYTGGSGKVAQEETETPPQQSGNNELPPWMPGSAYQESIKNNPDIQD